MDIDKNIIAYKYAKAFLNVFFSSISREDIDRLPKIRLMFSKEPGLMLFLKLSSIPSEQRSKYLQQFLEKNNLKGIWHDLVRALMKHKRIQLFCRILFYIEKFYFEKIGLIKWSVLSSLDLDNKEKDIIKNFLEIKSRKKAECIYSIEPTLIAGLKMQSHQYLWENSIQERIRELEIIMKN